MPNDTAPAWDGVPLNPERDGWHWVRWNAAAQKERGFDGTPMAMRWVPRGVLAHWNNAILDYLGPCLTPSEVTAREAAAWAAGAAAMREAAEVSADCGCDVRAIVLDRLASHGLREAERCCGQHYDACCALTAAAIRALPIPPMPTQGDNADE